MPRLTLPLASLVALVLAGCGDTQRDGPPARAVHVHLDAPADRVAVRASVVVIRGSVRPAGAQVLVRGHRAAVSGGRFQARIALAAGINVIDVLASDGDARPALTALRVRRLTTVGVPDVVGRDPDAAVGALRAVGLEADVQRHGGLFDALLGGTPTVCATDPPAGVAVDPGTTVKVTVARRC